MFPLTRSKTIKDIGEKLRARTRRYRLPRNGGFLAFTGTLLTFYRHGEAGAVGTYPPEVGYVDILAVFRTRTGRFLVYYVVACSGHDELTERREYAHACSDLSSLGGFLAAMTYPNTGCFMDRVLAEAAGRTFTPPEPAANAAAPDRPEQPSTPAAEPKSTPPAAADPSLT